MALEFSKVPFQNATMNLEALEQSFQDKQK